MKLLVSYHNLKPFGVALIAANLIPLAGVLVFNWDASLIILLYWIENLIIGFSNILKMAFLPVEHPIVYLVRPFPILFFCIHYGGFCAVHGAP